MQVVTAASSKIYNPRTLVKTRAMVYTFDTGHTLTVWEDGTRFHTTNTRALNPSHDSKVCERMNRLAQSF